MILLKYVTKGDILLIVVLSVLSVASIAGVRTLYHRGKHVVVEVDGRRVMELSLDTDVTKTVNGPLGETVIRIENGTARIIQSPCPHHYCIRMGRISYRGEIAVCVPNRVFVSISGGNEEDVFDGVTQ